MQLDNQRMVKFVCIQHLQIYDEICMGRKFCNYLRNRRSGCRDLERL